MRNYDLGNRIFELRKSKGLSQKELGSLLGVSNKSVSKWENGAAIPKTDTLVKLADIFGISAQELLQGKTDSKLTLKKLSYETNEMFLTEEIEKRDNAIKMQNISNQKKYLIITLSLFVSTFVLTFSLSGFGVFIDIEEGLKWYDLLLDSLMVSYMVSSVFSGIVFLIRVIKKAGILILVLLCVFFPITVLAVEVIGLVITPTYIITSIREIVRDKKNG